MSQQQNEALTKHVLSAAILEALKGADERLQASASQAAKQAVESTTLILADLIDAVEERLNGIKPAVTEIKINDKQVVLKSPMAECLPRLLRWTGATLIPIMVGPRGCGKTTAAAQVAESLQAPFFSFVLSADMGTSALFGRQTANGFVDSTIIQAVRSSETKLTVLFLDELDAGNEQSLIALNSLLDKSYRFSNTVTGETHIINPTKLIICCGANTFGRGADAVYVGRNRLDGSTVDRVLPMTVDYNRDLERTIARSFSDDMTLLETLWAARERLKEVGSDEGISTRRIEQAYRLEFVAGESRQEVLNILSAGWTEGLAEQVGMKG